MPDYVRELREQVGSRPLLLVAAGAIVKDTAGAILLQRNAESGQWGIPGGAMELGETLEEADMNAYNRRLIHRCLEKLQPAPSASSR